MIDQRDSRERGSDLCVRRARSGNHSPPEKMPSAPFSIYQALSAGDHEVPIQTYDFCSTLSNRFREPDDGYR